MPDRLRDGNQTMNAFFFPPPPKKGMGVANLNDVPTLTIFSRPMFSIYVPATKPSGHRHAASPLRAFVQPDPGKDWETTQSLGDPWGRGEIMGFV